MVRGAVPLDPATTLEGSLARALEELRALVGVGARFSPGQPIAHGAGDGAARGDGVGHAGPEHPADTCMPSPHPFATLAVFHAPPHGTCLDKSREGDGRAGSQAVRAGFSASAP